MQWPDDTLPTDGRLADALAATKNFRTDLSVSRVLRHVAGRRITVLATSPQREPLIVKVFHGPRARGNHRRLSTLRAAGLAHLVPATHGHDPSGRIGVLGFRDGSVLDEVADERFVDACGAAGAALAALHRSGAILDREWTITEELRQLDERSPDSTRSLVDGLVRDFKAHRAPLLVPSHRDCHPRQLVDHGDGVAWIDLDDAAMAPPGLDVGNMLAHLTREAHLGRRVRDHVVAARRAFLAGYDWRDDEDELRMWERLALARLAGLAERRHGRPGERDALLAELEAA